MRVTFSIDMTEHRELVRRAIRARKAHVRTVMKQHGAEAVNQITSLTGKTLPPIHAGEGPRRAHPGGWGDRSTNLRNAIGFEVKRLTRLRDRLAIGVMSPSGLEGDSLDNVIEYAEELDSMYGYSVLAGIPAVAFESLVNGLQVILRNDNITDR